MKRAMILAAFLGGMFGGLVSDVVFSARAAHADGLYDYAARITRAVEHTDYVITQMARYQRAIP